MNEALNSLLYVRGGDVQRDGGKGGGGTRVGEMGQCSNTVGLNPVLHSSTTINCYKRIC